MLAVRSPATDMHLDHPTASSSSSSFSCSSSSSLSSSSSSIANELQEHGDRTLDLGDSSESSSDEEEGGIFFGTHTDAESLFLAKLSAESSSSQPATPPHRRRQSRLVSMIRRDSTEFNRRKTMVFPVLGEEEEEKERSSDDRIQERYQREVSVLQISPSAFATEFRTSPGPSRNPLLNAFASMHIAPSPRFKQSDEVSESDSSESEKMSENGHSDSDKENIEVPPGSENGELAEEDFLGTLGIDVTRGMKDLAVDFDIATDIALDLGGMKLEDFADQEETNNEDLRDRAISYDSSEDEAGGPMDSPTIHLVSLPRSGSGEVGQNLESPSSDTKRPHSDTSPALSPLDQTGSPKEAPCDEADEDSSLLDDIPMDRAAVNILQSVLFSPLRTSDSPLRSLPLGEFAPPPYQSPFATRLEPGNLATADPTSPTRASTTPIGTPAVPRTPRQLGPLPTTATPSQVRGNLVPLAERNSKVLKPRQAGSSAVESAPPLKEKSRTIAVRGQLDSMFSKKVSTIGPPQRPLSVSSSTSSSSNENARPPSRTGTQSISKVLAKPASSKMLANPPRPGSSLSRSMPAPAKPTMSSSIFGRPNPAASSLSCRPPPPAPAARSALAPRSLVTHPAKQAQSRNMEVKVQRPAMPPPVSLSRAIAVSGPPPQVNPLKRPLSQSTSMPPSIARQTVAVGGNGPRPALGLPSRLVRDPNHPRGVPMFHIGLVPVDMSSRAALRSPLRQPAQRVAGTPMGKKTSRLGTPSRAEGTPRTIRAKASFQTLSQPADKPNQDVSAISPSKSSGSPATATRQTGGSIDVKGSADGDIRGSSADYEDVSMMLPQPPSSSPPVENYSSPESPVSNKRSAKPKSDTAAATQNEDEGGRPKRAVKPRTLAPPVAPYISGKELKTTTERNTMRNQVYFCAIDRQIVHIPGPRPPSPTSKIRTTADRDEDNKKKSREHRAKRRGARESGASTEAGSPERPIMQRVEQARGPGDDEDWKTPARPSKKAKREEKNVKWDRGLVIIHDDGSEVKPPPDLEEPPRGCVRRSAKVDLDKNGNINESARPKIELKRSKIVVTAVFYEGEEPVPVQDAPPPPASSASGKKKK